jgi:hypothetical protein
MKKFLILCSYFDGNSTGSLRMRALRESFIRYGYEVVVYTNFFPGSDHLDDVFAPQDKALVLERKSKVIATFYRVYRKIKFYVLGIKYHSFYKVFLNPNCSSFDLRNLSAVIVSVPQPEFVDVGIALSQQFRCPLITDFRDGLAFEPLGHDDLISRYFNLRLETRAVMNSKLVVSVSDALTENFTQRYKDRSNFVTITNGFKDPKKSSATLKENQDNGSLHVFNSCDDKVHILYSGAIEKSRLSIFQSLEVFEDAISKLEKHIADRLDIVFIGNYTEREIVKIQGFGRIFPPVSRDEIAIAQGKADFLLLFTGPDQSVVTMKLFDYLLARKPIISIGNAPTPERILRESGAGKQYRLSDTNDIMQKLSNLGSNQAKLDTDIDGYCIEELMDSFSKLVLESVCDD